MPTSENSSSTRLRAASPEMLACSSIASLTWEPTVVTGLRLVIGSWKIMPMRAPRTERISGTGSDERSRPSKAMRAPGSMRPGFGTSRMMASADIDLPQPDSPTSASVSPAEIEKPTRSTTVTRCAPSPGKEMLRSSTVSRGVPITPPCACAGR